MYRNELNFKVAREANAYQNKFRHKLKITRQMICFGCELTQHAIDGYVVSNFRKAV
jgi:hypothetical protein